MALKFEGFTIAHLMHCNFLRQYTVYKRAIFWQIILGIGTVATQWRISYNQALVWIFNLLMALSVLHSCARCFFNESHFSSAPIQVNTNKSPGQLASLISLILLFQMQIAKSSWRLLCHSLAAQLIPFIACVSLVDVGHNILLRICNEKLIPTFEYMLLIAPKQST